MRYPACPAGRAARARPLIEEVTPSTVNLTFHGSASAAARSTPARPTCWIGATRFHEVLDAVRRARRRPDHVRRRQRLRPRARAARAARARADRDLLRRRRPRRRARLPRRRPTCARSRDAGMPIGCHGMRHRPWRGLGDDELDEELVGAKRLLEDVVGTPVTEAACPFGSYDRARARRPARAATATSTRATAAPRGPATGSRRATRSARTTTPTRVARILTARGPAPADARSWRRSGGAEQCAEGGAAADQRRPTSPRVGRVPAREPQQPTVTAEAWARALDVPWHVEQPNAGFMLLDRRRGRRRATSRSTPSGRSTAARERFCNLGAWCVLRRAPVPQPAAAEGAAGPGRLPLHRPLAERQRHRAQRAARLPLRSTRPPRWCPNLPWPSRPGALHDQLRPGGDRAHAQRRASSSSTATTRTAPPARHVVLRSAASETCYVVVPQGPAQGPAGVRARSCT